MSNFKKNCISDRNNLLMLTRIFMVAALIFPFTMAMSSCGGDEEDEPDFDNKSGLYGIWFGSWSEEPSEYETCDYEKTIIFNSEGKLLTQSIFEMKAPGGAGMSETIDINSRYTIENNTIIVNGGTSKEYVLGYRILGDKLFLEYISGDNPVLIGNNDMVVYTNIQKIDLVEYPYGFWYNSIRTDNGQREFDLSVFLDDLSFYVKEPGSTSYKHIESYRYELSGNKMSLFSKDNLSTKPDCIVTYKVVGKRITFDFVSGEMPLFISLFESDSVTYTSN